MPQNQKETLKDKDEILLDWLQLSRSENVGPATFHQLLKTYKTAHHALNVLPELAKKGGLKRPLKLASRERASEELEKTLAFGAHILSFEDPLYPPPLRHIETAPPLLTVKGNLSSLNSPYFAIVGARNASALGKKMSYKFAQDLGSNGWGIASGLARGVDTSAHKGSLETGTLAVLAGGIDNIYPPENEDLYHEIAQKGLLMAESPWGVKPHSILFPRRNRLISGISQCLLVVEAALKSGSLITARYALDSGREVFAIPGHPLDPRARGVNYLIKNGAVLVETLEDILTEVSPTLRGKPPSQIDIIAEQGSLLPRNNSRKILEDNLSFVPIRVDELIRECNLSAQEVWIILLEMEIAGRLERLPGNCVALKEEWKSL